MELRPCRTTIINPRLDGKRIETSILVDPGMLIYHPLPKISEFRHVFQALFISSLYLLSDLYKFFRADISVVYMPLAYMRVV